MGRCLIVANQTLGGPELDAAVRQRIDSGHRDFHVVVPMVQPEHEALTLTTIDPMFAIPVVPEPTEDAMAEARRRSEHRLAAMLSRIADLGGTADGEVGDIDVYHAARDVLEGDEGFDEVIVSTLPAGISRWISMDLPSRIARLTDVPVTTVEARG